MDETLVEYDQKGDVLYIWYRRPATVENIITEEAEDLLIKKDQDTDEVIGVTIMHLSKRDSADGVTIPAASA